MAVQPRQVEVEQDQRRKVGTIAIRVTAPREQVVDRFVEVVRQVGRYWLAINLPPGRC